MKSFLTILFCAICSIGAFAQLCNGSFGDPVFEETFGNNATTGNAYGGALPPGVTSYTYSGNNNTQDGSYTITTSPVLALGSWASSPDHTDDNSGTGYMLVVNADANSTGEFYRKSVTNLCGSLVYQFSAYFMNVLPNNGTCNPAIPCNVKFVVEDDNGTELGSISTGDIPSTNNPQWINFAFEFSMPEGSSGVSVVLYNNALGGCGNDLAIDDITFRACGGLAEIDADYADFDSGVCPNDTVTFSADVDLSNYQNPAFQWQRSTNGGATWTDLAGETSSSITVTNFENGQVYRYLIFEAENVNSPNCQVASEAQSVVLYNTPANTPADMETCDVNENGIAEFNLNSVISTVLGGANTNSYTVTFHHSQGDAETGNSPITNPGTYHNTSDGEIIYVRVVYNSKGCYNTTSFKLLINELPQINTPVVLQQCDDDTDGISYFNLEEALPLISNEQYTYTFYNTYNSALNELSFQEISNPTAFTNTNQNAVYVTVKDNLGCFTVAEVQLQVSTSQIPNDFEVALVLCDTDADGDNTNGIETFDLSGVTSQILNLFSNNNTLNVTYYTSEADALAETNAITGTTYTNTLSPDEQWLYVRIDDNTNNSCFGLKKCVSLKVNPLPDFVIYGPNRVCLNDLPITLYVSGNSTQYNYTWYNPNGVNIGNLGYAYGTLEGEYTVVATTIDGGCSTTKTYTVTGSDTATITNIEITDVTTYNSFTVYAEGEGNYEYSINGFLFQDSPTFENLQGGTYTVYVRDKNGCGTISRDVCVIAFPSYFSPNGDGINDTWKAFDLSSDCAEGAIVNIFDRYGKLIIQLHDNEGWNGTYQDGNLPSDDYWFTVILPQQNYRRVKGHFTLKR